MVGAEPSVVVRGACPHDCPDTCAWLVTVKDGRAVELRGDPDHPFTRGGLCAKLNHFLQDRVYNPERLLHPLRRTGSKGSGEFERVSWDEALDAIAERLRAIVAEHGGQALLPYSYMGTQGMVQGDVLGDRLFNRLGATNLVRAVCGSAGGAGEQLVVGGGGGVIPDDIVHSRYVVLWGTNTLSTNLHLWPFIREAKREGAKVIVVDPVRTRTAQAADLHVRPLPGTDAALALGMMRVIVDEGLHDADYVERFAVGFEQLRERLGEYPPERVAKITGVNEDEIVTFAREYATSRPSVIRMLIGMEHRRRGPSAFRAISCLPALVGAWRDLGGGLYHFPPWFVFQAVDGSAGFDVPAPQGMRSVNMVQIGRALTELDPPIRAFFVWNSNPAAIAPNQNLVLQGLRREDLFTVAVEHFMTDMASHADYVLPATTQAEHLDLLWSWGHTYLAANLPAIEPCGEALPNTEIFRRLAARLGFEESAFRQSDEEIARAIVGTGHPLLKGMGFEDIAQRGWIDVRPEGEWVPYREGGFETPSGKAELYSESAAALGLDPLPGWEPADESPTGDPALVERFPLALITSKHAHHFLNSSYANVERALKAEGSPVLDVHPEDAAPRGIGDGAMVRVFNERGSVELAARVGDRVPPGVAAMPSGWWASRSPKGSSANALTSDGLSEIGEGGDFHDTLVQVELAR